MPKSYRIRTEVGVDKYINVNLEQDWESLEVLSLKILANDLYSRMCADYGVVVGRVFVNNGFGLPNAKVSVFIPLDDADELDPVISELYPYRTITDTNEEGYRYNLLPKLPSYKGHQSTGTFPNVADVLMDQSYIEVYDKYYRFTVTTNDSGDFMIFGVPIGNQTIVMDVDLSDIGCFSLSPQDLIQQGLATETQVNGSTFKTSTNLRELPQIKNLVFDVDVAPFWGDQELCQVGITRVDFDLTKQANINIQPTSIFMGSILSTTDDDALKVSCKPKNNTGNLCELVAGPGEIQAIRQTINSDDLGLPILEVYQVEQGGKVIDADGTYVLNVPMNLDYVFTNEFGEQVLSDDPSKGIPTKGKYRFKIKWQNEEGLQNNFQRANFLIPNVKEYGWSASDDDPFDQATQSYTYQIQPALITGATEIQSFGFDVGISFETSLNNSSYEIYLNGVLYTGSQNSIPFNVGDTIQIVGTPVNPNVTQDFTFKVYPENLFNLLKSYAFSLDWDDYVNPQEAIDCEDTFYEFKYNKVYTTAMFLDRYKNGLGRAKHLGIKEIDNRTCKSTVNTFPVNDIIRNFDPIFFVFNILINVLTFPLLVLLFVAHFISFMWPILKYVLIVLSIYLTYEAGVALFNSIQNGVAAISAGAGIINAGFPSVNVGWLLEGIRLIFTGIFLIAVAAFKFALAAAFFAFATIAAIKIKGFPRISLPMIAYPDCTSCDCDCKNAEMDDNFDINSVNDEIDAAAQGGSSSFYNYTLVPALSIIAPVNSAGSYIIDHPNLSGPPDSPDDNPFDCNDITGMFKTFASEIADENITSDLAIQASLDLARVISGYDVISSTNPNRLYDNEQYLLHAPQPFLWATDKPFGVPGTVPDRRFFAYPLSKTFPQQLNDFNTRDKYFNFGGAVNQIETLVNPGTPSQPFTDQVVVVLMGGGASGQIGIGNVCSFQNPNYTDAQSLNRLINLTGATLNQFGTNSITGTTLTGNSLPASVQYADPTNPQNNLTANIVLNLPQVSQLPVVGNPNVEESYLQFATDIEYFQLITGLTVNEFIGIDQLTSGYFPNQYLRHDVSILTPDCPPLNATAFSSWTINDVITLMQGYEAYEVCIFVRGVDPFTPKQTIKYDLSKIFGFSSFGNVTVEGSYYLNRPIQGYSTFASGNKPVSHVSPTNNVSNLYFPSFAFTPDTTKFTAFTSNLPYFYLCTDDTNVSNVDSYTPVLPTWQTTSQITIGPLGNGNLYQVDASSNYTIPRQQTAPTQYVGGGAFLGWNLNSAPTKIIYTNSGVQGCDQDCQKEQYYNTQDGWFNDVNVGGNISALYSPAYYRYGLTPVTFESTNIVMRSDRLPTSTEIENGVQNRTGYALHQNNNFTVYKIDGTPTEPIISAGFDLPSGEQKDEDPFISGLTNTLTCEGMVPLECYSGSGSNVGVIPPGQCSIPADRMVNGCYCLLNKTYLAQYGDDARLFLEWKTRFTMNFAACRGIFAQVFQNNWLNGALYMFSFNKRTIFNANLEPSYRYCEDVIVFNDLSNSFYYRSSPWNGNDFIGKDSPDFANVPGFEIFPGRGYNVKQIQFPTTVVDLGPRDSFINQICCSGIDGFGSYYADQLKTSSYQDNSDLIQLGFLSRILNEGVRQRMIPISTGGDSSEGKGIIQFFNSTRGGYRIDGDWAQMLSINSEWKVLPFITENVPSNNYIFFGDNYYPAPYPSGADIKPVFGVFFQTPEPNLNYRKIESPGIETYSTSPLIQDKFGYSKSQVVPHYKWSLKKSDPTMNIFGTEDNNWVTDTVYSGGFFNKKYQDLDFETLQEKYITQTTKLGYITNYVNNVPDPQPPIGDIIQGQPIGSNQQAVVVGAPYHFYFGLNNGKTAVDRFYKLYVATIEE
jgi:hypothetical protein